MKVRVGWRNIIFSTRGDGSTCAVAMAIRKAVPRTRIRVGTNIIVAGGKTVYMPPEVSEWIRRYDLGEIVFPIEFNLDNLEKVV